MFTQSIIRIEKGFLGKHKWWNRMQNDGDVYLKLVNQALWSAERDLVACFMSKVRTSIKVKVLFFGTLC